MVSNERDSFKKALLNELKDSEFRKLGLSKNPFLPYIPKLADAAPTFINRKNELKQVIRYLSGAIEGVIPLVNVTGTRGIGKTHFENYLYSEVNMIAGNIGHKLRMLNEETFPLFYEEYKTGQIAGPHLIFLDNSEKIWEKNKQKLIDIITSQNDIKVLAVWNGTIWEQLKSDSFFTSLRPPYVKLEKLEKNHLIDIVKTRVAPYCIKGVSPFDDKALELLAEIASGVPYSMIYFSEKILQHALDKGESRITEELVHEFIGKSNFKSYDLNKLTERQKEVLRTLLSLTTSEKRGVTSSEVADALGIVRTAAFHHLRSMASLGIVEYNTDAYRSKYYIKPALLQRIEAYFGERTEDFHPAENKEHNS